MNDIEITNESVYFKEFKNSYNKHCEIMNKKKYNRGHFLIYLTVKNKNIKSQIIFIMSDCINILFFIYLLLFFI